MSHHDQSARSEASAADRAARLPICKGKVAPERLGGGITNMNFVVTDAGARYVVRVGDDFPVHHVPRFNEAAASQAAHAAGISPEIVHAEPASSSCGSSTD